MEETKIFEGLSFAFNSHTKYRNDDAELANHISENGGNIARNIGKEVYNLFV